MEKSSRAWDNSISVHIHQSHVELSVYQSGQEESAVSTKELGEDKPRTEMHTRHFDMRTLPKYC